jgi:endoglucanase
VAIAQLNVVISDNLGVRLCISAIAALLLLGVVASRMAPLSAAPSKPGTADPWIGVRGNHLVDGSGNEVRLLGVNRSSADYECVKGHGIFEGPTDWSSIRAMKSWHINAVRLPLNESCWLGINGVDPSLSGMAYRAAIGAYVRDLERAGFYVILDLHWAAPGLHQATGLIPLPDAEHAPAFWSSVASEYRNDHSVIFDLFNEPHDVTWECWAGPCQTHDNWFGWYRSAGLPELLSAVRSAGASQPVMLGGLEWAGDLRGWLQHVPADPAHAIIASNHTYDYQPCYRTCRATLARIAKQYPVVTGELGETDCRRHYINPYMRWADRHGISYLGWAWDAGPGWTCRGGPSLIKDFSGTPTRFGVGLRNHLRQLARAAAGAAALGTPSASLLR